MNAQTSILPFSFSENDQIRSFIYEDTPWFIASDICKVLGLKNTSITIKSVDEDSRSKFNLGRQGNAWCVNEDGLYTIVLRCDDALKEGTVAYRFRRWVTKEVLPAIRKHGAYIAPHKEDDKSFIETFKNFCLQHNYSAREVEMFNWFGEMKLKQGYAIAMSKVEKESSEKEPANSDNKDGVFLPIHVAERLLDAVKWHRKNEQHMLDVIRALRNAAHIALQELPVVELYAERDGVMFDRLYWYLKELDQEQKQLENKA